jgi:hypothetical protein
MILSRTGRMFRCSHMPWCPTLACPEGCHDEIDYREDRLTDDSPALVLVIEHLEHIANDSWPMWEATINPESGQDALDEVCEDLLDLYWRQP